MAQHFFQPHKKNARCRATLHLKIDFTKTFPTQNHMYVLLVWPLWGTAELHKVNRQSKSNTKFKQFYESFILLYLTFKLYHIMIMPEHLKTFSMSYSLGFLKNLVFKLDRLFQSTLMFFFVYFHLALIIHFPFPIRII